MTQASPIDLDDPAPPAHDTVAAAVSKAAARQQPDQAKRSSQPNMFRRVMIGSALVTGGLIAVIVIGALIFSGNSGSASRTSLEPVHQPLASVEPPALPLQVTGYPPVGPQGLTGQPAAPSAQPAAAPVARPVPETASMFPETTQPAKAENVEIKRLAARVAELEAEVTALKRQPMQALEPLQRQLADIRAAMKDIKPPAPQEKEKPAPKELPVSTQWQLRSVSETDNIIYATPVNGSEYTRFTVGSEIPKAGRLVRVVRDSTGAYALTTTHKIVMPD